MSVRWAGHYEGDRIISNSVMNSRAYGPLNPKTRGLCSLETLTRPIKPSMLTIRYRSVINMVEVIS